MRSRATRAENVGEKLTDDDAEKGDRRRHCPVEQIVDMLVECQRDSTGASLGTNRADPDEVVAGSTQE